MICRIHRWMLAWWDRPGEGRPPMFCRRHLARCARCRTYRAALAAVDRALAREAVSERERAAAEAQRARAVVTAIREQGRLGADGAGAWDRVWCRRVGWRVGAGSGALAAALLVLAVWWAPGWFERGSGADVRDVTGDVQDTPRVETAWADAGAAWVGLMDMEGTDRFDAAVAALVGRHWHDELERLRRDADPIWHSIESYWPVLEPERRDERG